MLKDTPKTSNIIKTQQEILINLARTSSLLHQEIQDFLKEFELTSQQFNFLRILRGSQPESLCIKEVKARLVDRNSDVPRLVKRLEAKKYILKTPSLLDKRHAKLELSELGTHVLSKIDAKDPHFPASVLNGISEEKLQVWNEITALIHENILSHK